MNVKTEALAFKIWAFANPRAWDCSVNEIAAFLSETPARVGTVCSRKGWINRLRSSKSFFLDVIVKKDEGLDDIVKEINFD